ncbi:hypothetical protein SAMN02910275_01506 [Butyrivibrio sp. INlla18]|uniref:hypothetical protein n=1 Tax=Butyrivibrio sp. INlla18 TaxID=1520806 RepID=UPI00088FC2D3|nr:hypothetical protein [Butyrivibrio sp. INlla18]SDA60480.1 hypothetical protein SAMN02910275_01506 [Butyrivibrio sp. INlla18]
MMDANTIAYFQELSQVTGLFYSEEAESLTGVANGYHVTLAINTITYQLSFSVRANGMLPTAEVLKELTDGSDAVKNAVMEGNRLVVSVKGAMKNALTKNIVDAINSVTEKLKQYGYEDVCEYCGVARQDIAPYNIGGKIYQTCPDCLQAATTTVNAQIEQRKANENVGLGIVGALLGSLLGVLVIVLIGQLGYVAVAGGLVMGFTTLKGYELLAKNMSNKGLIISSIIMILMVYVAERIEWAIEVFKVYSDEHISFFEAFLYTPEVIKYSDATGQFIGSLVLLYIFTAVGVFGVIRATAKKIQ